MNVKRSVLAVLTLIFSMPLSSADAVNVNGVDFKYAKGKSTLEITLDKDAQPELVNNDADKQVVIEIKDAKIAKKLQRKLDTSSFSTNVVLISPYQSDGNVRIVLQLKEAGGVTLDNSAGKITATIDNKIPNEAEVAAVDTPAEKPADATTEAIPAKTEEAAVTETDKPDGTVDQLVTAIETKQYKGKKISIQLQAVDIQDVFKVISEASDLNIIVTEEVRGKVSLNLTEVPWDQALDILLKSNKLAAEKHGNVLRIATLDSMTKEKQAEVNAKKVVEAAEPLVVKIFPISYAKIDDLKNVIKDFLSKDAGGDGRDGATRGSIQTDNRTNALIVRDTPTSIEKIKRIIKELDTQTPQILIEAKFVSVTEGRSKEVAGKLFISTREFQSSTGTLSFNGQRGNAGAVFGGKEFSASASSLPSSFSVTPTSGVAFGLSPKTAGILPPGLRDITAFLSILESETSAKIISSPRIVTQNKETAEISQGQVLQIASVPGANASGGFQTVNATLKLSVTPQVTSDGSINVKLSFSEDSLSAASASTVTTDTKKVDTAVLVESGATLVIGGIYTSTVKEGKYGIPFLRDLPLLGWLFGSKDSTVQKGELFIFLTPRIINAKESGIQG